MVTSMKQTICQTVGCGKTVYYKTKKPKLCKTCREKLPAAPRRGRRPPKSSKKELIMSRLIMEMFPDTEVIHNGYYSWLRSPKQQPMQLDVYVPALRLALEFDGAQHAAYNSYMHGKGQAGHERFEYLQACDRLKDDLCQRAGIRLLRIRHDRIITKGYLLRRLDHEGVLTGARRITTVDDSMEGED